MVGVQARTGSGPFDTEDAVCKRSSTRESYCRTPPVVRAPPAVMMTRVSENKNIKETFFINSLIFSAASGPVRLFTPYKRRRRHQTEPDIVSVGGSGSGGGSLVTVGHIAGNVGPVMMGAVVTGSCSTTPLHSAPKKKRSLTEDESDADQMPQIVHGKEEDPWSLTEQIDASSDYIDSQNAGE